MKQASRFDGLSFDPFSLCQNCHCHLAEWGLRRILRPLLSVAAQDTRQSRTQRVLTRLMVEAGAIGCFALVAAVPQMMELGRDPVALAVFLNFGPTVLADRVVEALFRLLTDPFTTGASSRWLDMDDQDAKKLYLSFVGLAALASLFYFSALLFEQGGLVTEVVIGYTLLTRTVLAIALVLAFFANKSGVSSLIRKRRSGRDRGPRWQAFAGVWYKLASIHVVLSWLWTSVLVLVDSPDVDRVSILSFLIFMGGLMTVLGLDSWIYRNETDEGFELSVLQEVTSRVGTQAVAGATLALLIYVWLPTWDDLPILASDTPLRELVIQIFVTRFFAQFVWMLFVVSTRRLAGTAEDHTHQPRTRIETLLPLVRAVIIMSALGIDLLPLFAGASILASPSVWAAKRCCEI